MSVIPSEELDAGLRELMEVAKRYGREAERAAKDAGVMLTRLQEKPDLAESRLARLHDMLEDEVLISHEAAEGAVISEREEDREIAKAALAHLKLPQLRKIAGDIGLQKGGNLEQVAERIVLAFRADQHEIAQLVVRYEEEPPPDRRLTVRIYPLARTTDDVAGPADRLRRLVNRYMRVGIARWFIFEDVATFGRSVVLRGTYRHYIADAQQEDDEYRLYADKRWDDAALWFTAGEQFVRVDAKGDGESRAIVRAFSFATGIRKNDISIDAPAIEGAAFQWSPKTAFMIDLLINHFGVDGVEVYNLTTAGFERADDTPVQAEVETRPAVRSVRLQGAHLLDSRPACELIVAGQALVDLSLLVRFRPTATENFLLPLNVKLMRDNVAVSVGFGLETPEVARRLRDATAQGIQKALLRWPVDGHRLRAVADSIRERAQTEGPIERADMFAPPAQAEE